MSVLIRPSRLDDSERLGVVHIAAWQAAYRRMVSDDYLKGLDPVRNAQRRRRTFNDPSRGGTELVADVDGTSPGSAVSARPVMTLRTVGANCG